MVVDNRAMIKVLQWNARGADDERMCELYDLMREEYYDVACVCESYWKVNRRPRADPVFVIHRYDRGDGTLGGVAIVARASLRHNLLPRIPTKVIECLAIEVIPESGNKLVIVSAYLPGGAPAHLISGNYCTDLDLICDRTTPFFIFGDMNSRHPYFASATTNVAGRNLYEKLCSDAVIISHPSSPTHIPADAAERPSMLDIVITDGSREFDEPEIENLFSDHWAVGTKIFCKNDPHYLNPLMRPDFKEADWEGFQEHVHRRLESFVEDFRDYIHHTD